MDSSVIVSKMKPDGSGLVYSTLIGGSSFDLGLGIAADASGNVYVAGYTISGDFPVTNGAFATRPAGSNPNITRRGDCFVLKLNPAGNALVYSTYLPGADADACLALAIDSTGNAYVTGLTRSSDFPRTDGVFQQRFNLTGGDQVEAFVAKLNPTGSSLVYSSLLGGPGVDVGTGIAVDSSGNTYVTGFTSSATGFPVTLGAFQTRFRTTGSLPVGRERDAFAVKVNPSGSALLYGTYLGGSGDDMGFGIAIDSQGTAVICGNAMSADFPVTSPTYQASNRGAGGQERPEVASGDAFVAKLNAQGSALLFSTFLGGSKDDRATACALDTSGRVMVTGYTLSPDFPVTGDAAQRAYGGSAGKHFSSGDAFFAQLSANGTALLYSTYLGGAADEAAVGLSVDGSGSSFISGGTGSSNFLATSGAFQRVFGGMGRGSASQYVYGDGFVTKFGPADGSGAGSAPSIASLSDAASYVGGAVAPGEIVVLTGTAIGPAQLATAALASPDSLSNLVAETRVLFDDVPSPIIYVSAGQTAVVVPFTVAGRQSTAVVAEYKGVRSPAITVPVVAFKPALFTANASGRGPVAALNQDNSINSASNGAARGSVIQLFGTGSGQTQPPSVDGRLSINVVPRIALPVTITIAGITADVLYAGAAPGAVAGLFQMNVAIPVTTPSGDQPITVRIGDSATAQSGVTVAVR